MATSLLPKTSPTAVTGLTLDDILGTSDLLGLSEDPTLASILGHDPLGLGFAKKKKGPKYPDLPKDEQQSVVKDVLNVGAGGLQVLGDALDKPGRAVRGLLSGNVRELGNLVPFSDSLGITNPDQAVTGRQLLEKAGIVGANTDKGWMPDTGDIAGLAADIAFDPLTYLTFGASAVGKAGQIAKAAGVSVKGAEKYNTIRNIAKTADRDTLRRLRDAAKGAGTTLADIGDQQLGGLFGVQLPGAATASIPQMAQGATAQKIGDVLGSVTGPLGRIPIGPNGVTLGRAADALFDPAAGGFLDPLKQDVSRRAYAEAGKGHRAALEELVKTGHGLDDLVDEFHKAVGGTDPIEKTADTVRRAVQLSAEQRNTNGVFGMLAPNWQVPQHLESKAGAFGDALTAAQDALFAKLKETGVDPAEMVQTADFAHLFRQTTKDAQNAAQGGGAVLGTSASGLKARNQPTKFIPGEYVNQMLHDENVLYHNVATGQMKKPGEIAAYLNNVPEYSGVIQKAAAVTGQKPLDVAEEMGKFIAGKGDTFYKNGNRYYNDDIIRNNFEYSKGLLQAKANADATHGFFHANLTNDPSNAMTVSDAFKALGWDDTQAAAYFTNKYGPQALNGLVPDSIVAAAKSVREKNTSEWLKPITELLDPITRFYKKNLTLPFPSFHLRNLVSGHWMNLASNEINTVQDLLAYKKAWKQATDAVADPLKHRQFLDEMVVNGVIPLDFKTNDVDILMGKGAYPVPTSQKQVTPVLGQLRTMASIPGEAKAAYSEARLMGDSKLKAGLKAAVGAPSKAGAEAAKQIEYSNRATMYAYLRNKGWSPQAAAERVSELQVDYSKLSPFEKNVMKRVVPFYTFTRRNVPEVLKNLYERPGGLTGQTVRASNTGRDSSEYIPAYIGEGMSIPTPSGGYLSELGLPTDQFGKLFASGPTAYGTTRRTLQKLGSNLHPLAKLPIELMTGTNLFTGKQLTDLYQYPTKSTLANAILGDSPGSRVMSVARTAGDDRKDTWERLVNLATGARISHPMGGLEAQADRAAKQIMEEILKEDSGIGSFQNVYVKEDAQLSPEVERLLRAYRGIQNEQRKEKKATKK